MAPIYSQGADGAMIVFELGSRESFDSIQRWIGCLTQTHANVAIIIVGNKSDLSECGRVVSFDEAEALARSLGFAYYETSAKTGAGVDETFEFVAERALAVREVEEDPPPLQENDGKRGCC
jgi:GTPase SAR1 family protein